MSIICPIFMAHKKKVDNKTKSAPYSIQDAMNVTDDLFKLSKEKKYNPGAFIHGLVFALEVVQKSYNVPQQQMATIKRDCRKYVDQLIDYNLNNEKEKK